MTLKNGPIIQFVDFSYAYSGTSSSALKSVDLLVEKGTFVGFTGPTGAGKTTLIKAINGIIPHFEGGKLTGRILVRGKDTLTMTTGQIARIIGTVFDDPEAQIVCLDVEQELAFGLENFGIPPEEMEERITSALAMVGISHLRRRSTQSLSGGQKQRLAIAAAIALLPEVLVLDEPTSELDPLGSEEVFKVLKQLNNDHGITVLIAEQKTELLARYCDNLVVLNQGIIAVQGHPKDVFMNKDIIKMGVGLPQITELALRLEDRARELPLTLEEGIIYCQDYLSRHRR
ncbi:energy-coupling factor ABC transporter ATP-binding protein [Desulforamulus aquiferis]|uniref:ABC transporter ATP-binding protein n=1 Tax=Desulforamulus aquiferis TaxID=1397668 RepID=A0AAW7ZA52_9FIRM|nr:ABC transporter ATP-binding protein [Desulforamulus aquiferis]MDO7786542.1 ABC transporter ATP-binding protein [Desulforamulus aquiferis]